MSDMTIADRNRAVGMLQTETSAREVSVILYFCGDIYLLHRIIVHGLKNHYMYHAKH